VGIVKLIASLLMSAYYPVLMAVSFFSLIWSAKGPIPFNECNARYQRIDEVVQFFFTSKNTFFLLLFFFLEQ
jgi:hypothetical protein